jgi:renalase
MMFKIGIIGAGVAGAALAHALKDFAQVMVFEKARGVGGRLSSRYSENFEFDLGAPFFRVHHPAFQGVINDLCQKNIMALWSYKAQTVENGNSLKQAYVALPKMNHLSKFLLKDVSVSLCHKVTMIEAINGSGWRIYFDDGHSISCDFLISTAPPIQTQAIFPPHFEYADLLAEIELNSALVLMLGLQQPLNVSWDVLEINDDSLQSCVINSRKPGRVNQESLVVITQPVFAAQHLDKNKDDVIDLILKKLQQHVSIPKDAIVYQGLHQWRYANWSGTTNLELVCLDKALKLGVCGDWTMGGGVEGAYLSGVKMAHELRKIILESSK